jgi:hypothetical protein
MWIVWFRGDGAMRKNLMAWGVLTLIGAAFVFAASFGESTGPSCGDDTMRPGDVCVSKGGSETTYEQEVESTEDFETFGPPVLMLVGAAMIFGSRVAAKRDARRPPRPPAFAATGTGPYGYAPQAYAPRYVPPAGWSPNGAGATPPAPSPFTVPQAYRPLVGSSPVPPPPPAPAAPAPAAPSPAPTSADLHHNL